MATEDGDEEAPKEQSSPAPAPVRERPRSAVSARGRGRVFERLSQALGPAWKIGDRVQVRDRDDWDHVENSPNPWRTSVEPGWKSGKVVSLNPMKVQVDGGTAACTWKQIRAETAIEDTVPMKPPGPDVTKSRARSLSKRRRVKEKEERLKHSDSQLRLPEKDTLRPLPRVADSGEDSWGRLKKLKRVRDAVQAIFSSKDDEADIFQLQKVSEAPAKPRPNILGLHRGLAKEGLKFEDLFMLPVKERKGILEDLGHPVPKAPGSEKDILEWLQGELWSLRCKKMKRQQLPPREAEASKRLSTADHLPNLIRLRARLEEACSDQDTPFGLGRLFKLLSDLHLEIDDLDLLMLKELKDLMNKVGVNCKGLSKEDMLERLRRTFWSQRTRRLQKQQNDRPPEVLQRLANNARADTLKDIREAIENAKQSSMEQQQPLTILSLDHLLKSCVPSCSLQDLELLRLDELKWLKESMGFTGPGSKADIVNRLEQELWREKASRRFPSGWQMQHIEELCAPKRREVQEDLTDVEKVEDEFIMEYDMDLDHVRVGAQFQPADAWR